MFSIYTPFKIINNTIIIVTLVTIYKYIQKFKMLRDNNFILIKINWDNKILLLTVVIPYSSL
jgi:hypothetical protein